MSHLRLSLHPSKRFTFYLALLYSGAFLCVLSSQTPFWLKLIMLIICLSSATYAIKKYTLLRSTKSVTQCIRLEKDTWLLITKSGIELKANLLGNSWWSPYLLILNFKIAESHKKISVLVLRDMLEASTFRQMCVYLNMEAHTYA